MEGLKFYRCNECGNLMLVIVDPSVIPVCCGHTMEEMVANDTDADGEKHVPLIEEGNGKATVRVGAVEHPMQPEHRIEWIAFANDGRVDLQRLGLTGKPRAEFMMKGGCGKPQAYIYCNLHGLWRSE